MSKSLNSRNINELLMSNGSGASNDSASVQSKVEAKVETKVPEVKAKKEEPKKEEEEDVGMGGLFDWKIIIIRFKNLKIISYMQKIKYFKKSIKLKINLHFYLI